MTDKVQWKTLPTKANRDMEQAGADAAREYLERTGSNNLWVIYEAMAAAAPKPPASTEPVAVLYANGVVLTKADCGDVFDICCKVETPLYTHADPGEFERLVAANTEYARRHLEQHGEVERLRAQLAERDALLAIAYGDIEHASKSLGQCVSCGECPEDDDIITHDPSCAFCAIEMALASSGKVSVPLERDERTAFEASYAREFSKARGQDFTAEDIASMRDSSGGYGNRAYLNGQWVGWQARAALEQKP